jgi:hypothetical protein
MEMARSSLAVLRQEIAARLRHVCENWPEERFNFMVDSIAAITLKYGLAEPTSVYDRRSTDRLLDDLKDLSRRLEKLRDG